MRKLLRALLVASALMALLAAAPALYAHDSEGSQRSTMGSGMTSEGGMMGGGNMMGQMNQMMDNCNKMMQGMMNGHDTDRPNDQWRKDLPGQPEKQD